MLLRLSLSAAADPRSWSLLDSLNAHEATFLHAEALERLAVLVDEGQERGEIAKHGTNRHTSRDSNVESLDKDLRPRVSEGRSLVRTGALAARKSQQRALELLRT